MITQAPRGTSDWFGDKMRTRTQVEAMARNLCEKFNIKEVITPVPAWRWRDNRCSTEGNVHLC